MHRFSHQGEENNYFKALKNNFCSMKKMLLIVAVAFAAMSCGNKCCEKKCCQEAEAAEAVEVVEADSVVVEAAEAEVEAPAAE